MPEHRFDTPQDLDAALAAAVTSRLEAAITARGHAYLVVSGGSTPRGFFTRLAKASLTWENVTILLADERWVPATHEDSNERMVRKHLLENRAHSAAFLSLVGGYPDEPANLSTVKQQLATMGTFDVVILGMGLDGHTASLFPDAPELAEALATSQDAIMTHPQNAPHSRVTLSRSRLGNTRFGVVHIVGQDKLSVLAEAQQINDCMAHPVVSFFEGDNPFEVYYAPS